VADLHRLALVVAGPDRADDVTQDAFVRAWQELPRLRDPERFVPWLRRILVNRARDLHRAGRRQPRLIDVAAVETVADHRPGRVDPAAGLDRLVDLHRALGDLSVDQRAVVGLHYLTDLTLPDVARTLEVPLGTAKSRLNAALVVLRQRLEEDVR
jgi:RNA polymerase sigma-70 factor (ECF subfamily)